MPLQMSGDLDTPSGGGWLEEFEKTSREQFRRATILGAVEPPEAGRIIRDPPICQLAEEIDALAGAVMTRTGRHGITRISLTPDVGLSFGIAPGTSVDVATSAGRVEVYAEVTSRLVGTFHIDAASDEADKT